MNAANRSPDGWGALSKFDGLGTLVAAAARRAAEPRVSESISGSIATVVGARDCMSSRSVSSDGGSGVCAMLVCWCVLVLALVLVLVLVLEQAIFCAATDRNDAVDAHHVLHLYMGHN